MGDFVVLNNKTMNVNQSSSGFVLCEEGFALLLGLGMLFMPIKLTYWPGW